MEKGEKKKGRFCSTFKKFHYFFLNEWTAVKEKKHFQGGGGGGGGGGANWSLELGKIPSP